MYGHKKEGARFGHAKVGGYNVLLRGLSPLVATLSTPLAAPVVAAARLRNVAASSVKGAASLLAEAVGTARAAGATGVAETGYTAFAGTRHAYDGRLVVRRVRDRSREQDELFPVWRYHAFFTDTALSTVDADLTHRQHAVVETVFADLIDGPLAHLPSVILSR
jgi:hypothetical protein